MQGLRPSVNGVAPQEQVYEPTAYLLSVPKLFAHLRSTLGAEIELMHDAHEQLDPIQAARLAKELEPFRLFFLEDPLMPEHRESWPLVRAASTTPLASTGSRSSEATAPGVIANCGLVVAVRAVPLSVAVAVRTLFVPDLSMLKPLKVATPAAALTVAVPDRVPVPPVRVSAMLAVASEPEVTVLPSLSCTLTTGWRANAEPATVEADGWVVKASWVAGPAPVGEMVAVVEVRPGEVKVRV